MSSDEEEYEVERILAEKVIDAERKFLVKWKGYPDEECTWEPAENFNAPETLEQWAQQKANDDILEEGDLQRIQQQMNAFQARLAVKKDNDYSSEGQSDPDLDAEISPAKRLKMVHDPPPVRRAFRKKQRSVAIPARSSHLVRNSDPSATPKAATTKSDKLQTTEVKSAMKEISKPENASNFETTRGIATELGQGNQPMTFHAPDLTHRKRRTESQKRKQSAKPFKNLQHMNNARKLQQSERMPHSPRSGLESRDLQTEKFREPEQRPQEQPNDSWLFFSEDSKDDSNVSSSGSDAGVDDKRPNVSYSNEPSQNDFETVKIPTSKAPDDSRHVQTTLEAGTKRKLSMLDEAEPKSKIIKELPSKVLSNAQPTSHSYNVEELKSASPVVTRATTDTRDQDKSGAATQDHRPKAGERVEPLPLSDENDRKDEAKASEIVTTTSRSRKNSLADTTYKGHPSSTYSRETIVPAQPAPSIHNAHPASYVGSKMAVVKAGGREWLKGDLILDIWFKGTACGGVKVQNLPWDERREIIRLKPKHEHILPIRFDNVLSWEEYDALSKLWWARLAVGAVEAFPESEPTMSSLANHLETYNIAACWEHPDVSLDRMIILYSSESASWHRIAKPQATRIGQPRLHMFIRTRFGASQPFHTREDRMGLTSHTVSESPIAANMDASDEGVNIRAVPGSRAASILSNAGLYRASDALKSPSEQLTREMAEYGLENHSNLPDALKSHAAVPRPRSKRTDSFNQTSDADNVRRTVHDTSTSRTTLETSVFAGLDRNIQHLSRSPILSKPGGKLNVYILIAYQTKNAGRAQQIREWLLRESVDPSNVLLQSADVQLADSEHQYWREFKSQIGTGPCILICDDLCQLNRMEGLGKLVEQENLTCWRVNLEPTTIGPLSTIRLFPAGRAVAIAQDCYLNELENVIYILNWLRGRAEQPGTVTKLILPPRIISTIQEQAALSTFKDTKQMFLDLMALVEEFISLSGPKNLDRPFDMDFMVILPDWNEVYKHVAFPTHPIPMIEQKKHDRVMSDAFMNYFGLWALQNVTRHRRFLGFITATKPTGNEHIRFHICKVFVEQEKARKGGRGRSRSRSRDPSIGRDQSRTRS